MAVNDDTGVDVKKQDRKHWSRVGSEATQGYVTLIKQDSDIVRLHLDERPVEVTQR